MVVVSPGDAIGNLTVVGTDEYFGWGLRAAENTA